MDLSTSHTFPKPTALLSFRDDDGVVGLGSGTRHDSNTPGARGHAFAWPSLAAYAQPKLWT
jgi:hypothetical protein